MSVSLVVGLGNPGSRCERTRHNAGWNVVTDYARSLGVSWREERAFQGLFAKAEVPGSGTVLLLRPLTFMNESGVSVQSVVSYFKINIDSVVVVYDELTLPLGRIKVSLSGSAGGHNGVASLLAHVGDGFTRLRIGIGPKLPKHLDLADFVLAPFLPTEQTLFEKLTPDYTQALALILKIGPQQAMNRLNQRTSLHEPE